MIYVVLTSDSKVSILRTRVLANEIPSCLPYKHTVLPGELFYLSNIKSTFLSVGTTKYQPDLFHKYNLNFDKNKGCLSACVVAVSIY